MTVRAVCATCRCAWTPQVCQDCGKAVCRFCASQADETGRRCGPCFEAMIERDYMRKDDEG